jgi:hypothetical protein
MAKRARPGDVLEVQLQNGNGYLQYLGAHPEYGDAIAVCPAILPRRPVVTTSLFDESYVTFYPARTAVAQGLVAVLGNLPAFPVPIVLRRPGARLGRKVETWVIEGRTGETVKQVLDVAERRIPIAAIWNHNLLVQRIGEGWRPEQEA